MGPRPIGWSMSIFGPSSILASVFMDPSKLLLSLGFIVPLILLYLIRPKPKNVAVPSLMFIFKDMGKSNMNRFLRTLLRDFLFLFQLLAILLLALPFARPFIQVSRDQLVQQSILVLDISASARAQGDDVFDEAISLAKDNLAKDNVVILAHRNPRILGDPDDPRLSVGDASDLIDDLEPTEIPGDLPGALELAQRYVGEGTKVVIVTDRVLSSYENPDLIEAKAKVLRSKGAIVELLPVETGGKNVGIIDGQLNVNNATIELKIQNFDTAPREIGLEYNGKAIALPKNILEPSGKPGSLLSVTVPLANGKSEFLLTPKDDFMVDNHYYVSIPDRERIGVLLISNDQAVQQSRLIPALEAAGDQFTKVGIQYGVPPKVPDLEHDLYIIKDINTQFILPGVVNGLREKVEQGAVLIVYAQPGLFSIDWGGLLPIQFKDQAQPLTGREEIITNSTLSLMRGLSDIGQVDGEQLLRVKATPDAIVYASVATNDGREPVIAARRLGKGAVIYYGIRDRPAVDLDPQSYAIIWGRIVDFSLVDPLSLNLPAGAVLPLGRIKTPWGTQDAPVLMREGGFYTNAEQTFAANLYPLRASLKAGQQDISGTSESGISTPVNLSLSGDVGDRDEEEAKVPKDLSDWLIIAGLIALVFELIYIKMRGDL